VDNTSSTFCRCKPRAAGLTVLIFLLAAAGCDPSGTTPAPARESVRKDHPSTGTLAIEVPGRTQCIPERRAIIAPTPLHPVVEVKVSPGDRVKKGQTLVKIDDDEPQADVRAKQAALEQSEILLTEARRHLTQVKKLYEKGALSEHRYHESHVGALKSEKDVQAAKAALDSAKAELEHYTVEAPIDGIVSWLDVYLGMVSRPGTTTWGEILDLSEIDVRCALTPDQADEVALGQSVEIWTNGKKALAGKGKVVFIGIAADKKTGLVPVVIRLANPNGRLRSEVPVQVRFLNGKA
jgi:RND family efflux transporter MFP subunit